MVLLEDNKKVYKYILIFFSILLYTTFLVYLLCLIVEFINNDGWDLLELFDFIDDRIGLVGKGDVTVWFHIDLFLNDYIYSLIYALQVIYGFIIYRFIKRKIWIYIIFVWIVLFVISLAGVLYLERQQVGFLLSPYYWRFLTMQFINIGSIWSRLIYWCVYIFFVAIHVIGLKSIFLNYKNR